MPNEKENPYIRPRKISTMQRAVRRDMLWALREGRLKPTTAEDWESLLKDKKDISEKDISATRNIWDRVKDDPQAIEDLTELL